MEETAGTEIEINVGVFPVFMYTTNLLKQDQLGQNDEIWFRTSDLNRQMLHGDLNLPKGHMNQKESEVCCVQILALSLYFLKMNISI